ncbi:ribonuclease P protein component [Sphingomonas sinipercae]|uniref:Ribonuclease P protein component n=1 Tax=Sphingomonas sinipercae TaxID=2714944 RepID=A0A6G7ZQU1_9SPHN|nr:ribonuclease P protein component [Sphingomonas sinipercae]QIL03303.1 ribonuclease P protein component [Sphingomonas sinipercae]
MLKQRADFLAANSGRRAATAGFVLLVRDRKDGDSAKRVGFTVTKKIGNAVVRNRMKRRFRALAREILPARGFDGSDHVMIGRSSGIERDFGLLREDLTRALQRVAP